MSPKEISTVRFHLDLADGLLITAGAGMGVDSGLPDFRGKEGFWQAYPALREAGIAFQNIACPDTFLNDPALAWGFYGHRLNLYRDTVPHAGFDLLLDYARHKPQGAFVYTSNVDGQFQKAGFNAEQVLECHGSIHHLQCQGGCTAAIWTAGEFIPEIDEARCRLLNEPPHCHCCGEIARPNILMFNDYGWLDYRYREQLARFQKWRSQVERLAVIEIGAGTSIPSVRHFGEFQEGYLVRINPREPDIPHSVRGISLVMNGLDGLRELFGNSPSFETPVHGPVPT